MAIYFMEPSHNWGDRFDYGDYFDRPYYVPSVSSFDLFPTYSAPKRLRNVQPKGRCQADMQIPNRRAAKLHLAVPMEQIQRVANARRNDPEEINETRLPFSRNISSPTVRYTPKRFDLNLRDFRPENVQVKVIANKLVVEAKQEQMERGSYTKLEMLREFELGPHFDLSGIKCVFTNSGELKIEVPCVDRNSPQNVPIQMEADTPTNLDAQSDNASDAASEASGDAIAPQTKETTIEETEEPEISDVPEDQVAYEPTEEASSTHETSMK